MLRFLAGAAAGILWALQKAVTLWGPGQEREGLHHSYKHASPPTSHLTPDISPGGWADGPSLQTGKLRPREGRAEPRIPPFRLCGSRVWVLSLASCRPPRCLLICLLGLLFPGALAQLLLGLGGQG